MRKKPIVAIIYDFDGTSRLSPQKPRRVHQEAFFDTELFFIVFICS